MKIQTKDEQEKCEGCNYEEYLIQLDGWKKDDWLCSNCFVNEIIDSEADYEIISTKELEEIRLKTVEEFLEGILEGLKEKSGEIENERS